MKNTRKITMLGVLSAIAFILTVVCRIPIMPSVAFITYDPKDVIIAIGGFIFGPFSALIMSLIVSFIEFFSVSETGVLGLIMNVISSACFTCIAAAFYKHKPSFKSALSGLIIGTILMTVIMVGWNYIITPIYMGLPREQVVPLLIPVIMPLNLLKGGINVALTLILYKPIVNALRRAGLLQKHETDDKHSSAIGKTGLIAGVLILVTCIIIIALINK